MKKVIASIVFGISIVSLTVLMVFSAPKIFTTGTTVYQPDQAYRSYILVADHNNLGNHPHSAMGAQGTVPDDICLIDMNGCPK